PISPGANGLPAFKHSCNKLPVFPLPHYLKMNQDQIHQILNLGQNIPSCFAYTADQLNKISFRVIMALINYCQFYSPFSNHIFNAFLTPKTL
ncbi:hypothetical protein VP01_8123g1, partial [Puccinia sorghi]